MAFDFSRLNQFYARLERETDKLIQHFGNRLKCCAGCADCCVDGLSVWVVEAAHIQSRYSEFLQTADLAPQGVCAFLDEKRRCRIYSARPYVCRTQGLPLSWLEENDSGEFNELRDICPLNEENIAILHLEKNECWQIGPFESELAQLQQKFGNGQMTRIPLRSLFQNSRSAK